MDKQTFMHILNRRPILLDGATGTGLQAAGLPVGACPEIWVLDHPEILGQLQKQYYDAGSDLVYAFSFGANRSKLSRHGIPDSQVEAINEALGRLSCEIRDEYRQKQPDRIFLVAGDLSPTGKFLQPAGDMPFDDLVDIYRQQVRGLLQAGVDCFVAETMLDLAQTRAAVLAVQAECALPMIASLTVESNGRTLSGNTLATCLITLQSMGVAAVGLNCSFGPDIMAGLIEQVLPFADCFLLAKPNAGLPRLVDGQTRFDMDPVLFTQAMQAVIHQGVRLIGGCCGTTPDHIRVLNGSWSRPDASIVAGLGQTESEPALAQGPLQTPEIHKPTLVDHTRLLCSGRSYVAWTTWQDAGWPVLSCPHPEDLPDKLMDCLEDEPQGVCIDLTAFESGPLADWLTTLDEVQTTCTVPLGFRSDNVLWLEQTVRRYHGRALILTGSAFSSQACLIEPDFPAGS